MLHARHSILNDDLVPLSFYPHTQSPIPPDYVFWFHNDMLLNFQPKRDGVKVETDYGSRTHSKLEIKDANESDTGNYTCSTSSGKPYSIYVQVLAGKSATIFYFCPSYPRNFLIALSGLDIISCFPSIVCTAVLMQSKHSRKGQASRIQVWPLTNTANTHTHTVCFYASALATVKTLAY